MNNQEEILLENMNINEDVNVSPTQEILREMVFVNSNNSLLESISEVLPVRGAIGKVYTSVKDNTIDKFTLVSKDIIPVMNNIKTAYTPEVFTDMKNMFGKSANTNAAIILKSLSNEEENTSLLEFLSVNSFKTDDIILSGSSVNRQFQQILTKVSECVIQMNLTKSRTLENFCILPKGLAAIIMGGEVMSPDSNVDIIKSNNSLYIGKWSKTHFFISPHGDYDFNKWENASFSSKYDTEGGYLPTSEDVDPKFDIYVGLISDVPGMSSLIYSPHSYDLKHIIDPSDSSSNLFLYNRYALNTNVLHKNTEEDSLIYRFRATFPTL